VHSPQCGAPTPACTLHDVSHFHIECPNCGPRPCSEFSYNGEVRPLADPGASEQAEIARLWLRRNVDGPQRERWFHAAGCRRFVTITRDTRDNRILAQPGEPAGDVEVHA
jgi:heterotetrameric sarcosine oxidase delta subunit